MAAIREASGITFKLNDVERATTPLQTVRTDVSLRELTGVRIDACSDLRWNCIKGASFHALIEATWLAYCQHRPLILSPDMIWATLLQGFAQHVNQNAEALRHHFVSHEGRREIVVARSDFHPGAPENPWDELVDDFSREIKSHLLVPYDNFLPRFSTTGRVERIACEIALMDAFQQYFEYTGISICGIPTVTLEGTIDDWGRLRTQIEIFEPLGLDWWLPAVRTICDHFVMAAEGDVDHEHWGRICNGGKSCGGAFVSGWVALLIPYVSGRGEELIRNPLLTKLQAHLRTSDLSTGLSCAPVTMKDLLRGTTTKVDILGGFVGIEQDQPTLALRPKLGWGVRTQTKFSNPLVSS